MPDETRSVSQIVQFQNTEVSLGGRIVLKDLSLELDPGQTLGVVGPNGSGKTTLVRTLATLISIARGTAHLLGHDLAAAELPPIRRSIGMISHEPALIDELTLSENLTHIARLGGVDPSRVAKALDVVGLSAAADRRARQSSFGMRRRVEIAHLLLTRPRLLLLDEAAAGLDSSAQDLIGTMIEGVCRRGGAAVVVSHDRGQLDSLTQNVVRLDNGRLK